MPDLTIYVLTRNRSEFLIETLDSIINQTYKDFNIIVSDNSTNNLTEKKLDLYPYKSDIRYVKRDGLLSGIEHLNIILSEANTKFLMMFHDDDVMLPEMISKLYSYISSHIDCLAVSCNAYILNNEKFTLRKIIKSRDVVYENISQMARCYIRRKNIPLFPSYIYNLDMIRDKKLYFNRGRKYADASFICSLLADGKIFFLSQPLFYYRIHIGQDSHSHDSIGYSQMLHYITRNASLNIYDRDVVKFRLYHIYWNYISNKDRLPHNSFLRLIKLFTFKYDFVLLLKLLVKKYGNE